MKNVFEGLTVEETIKDGRFVSVWDDGYEIATTCKINMETRQVFDIEPTTDANSEMVEILDREYVVIDGIEYPVVNADDEEPEETDFWY